MNKSSRTIVIKKNKNNELLQVRLMNVLREQFNLRIKAKIGQLKEIYLLKQSRRRVAFIKFCLFKNVDIYKKK